MITLQCESCHKSFTAKDDENWKTVCPSCYSGGYRPERNGTRISNQQILDEIKAINDRIDKMIEVYQALKEFFVEKNE